MEDVTPTRASAPLLAPPDLPVRTRRLVLRPVQEDDRDVVAAYCSDPEVTRYLPFAALDDAGVEERLARMVAATAPSHPGERLVLAVDYDGAMVGDVMLALAASHGPADPPAIGELGWVFSPAVAGRGFATEAAQTLVDLAFAHYPLHRLMAQLDPRNTASARLCERLGMRLEAHTRQDFADQDGTWSDTAVYGLLRAEWEHSRRRTGG